jgi:hypothetical protein
VQNLNIESPLLKTIEASVYAIPKLAKVRKIIAKDGCKATKELPIEIDLGDDFKFHDVFVCPVAKEVAFGQNTPQLLTCGHVISKHALQRINRNEKSKFKCHTCPTQMTREEVKEITLYPTESLV